jgi:protoheme ferro-lyase
MTQQFLTNFLNDSAISDGAASTMKRLNDLILAHRLQELERVRQQLPMGA